MDDPNAGDCAVVAAFISYLGPFNKGFRQELVKLFQDACTSVRVPFSQDLNVVSSLLDEPDKLELVNQVQR